MALRLFLAFLLIALAPLSAGASSICCDEVDVCCAEETATPAPAQPGDDCAVAGAADVPAKLEGAGVHLDIPAPTAMSVAIETAPRSSAHLAHDTHRLRVPRSRLLLLGSLRN